MTQMFLNFLKLALCFRYTKGRNSGSIRIDDLETVDALVQKILVDMNPIRQVEAPPAIACATDAPHSIARATRDD
jgi:hypothetical protein